MRWTAAAVDRLSASSFDVERDCLVRSSATSKLPTATIRRRLADVRRQSRRVMEQHGRGRRRPTPRRPLQRLLADALSAALDDAVVDLSTTS